MFAAIINSFGDVFKKNFRNVFFKTIFLTVVSYILIFSLVYLGLEQVMQLSIAWLDTTLTIIGWLAAFCLSLFLLPSVVACLSELFSDEVIINTEKELFTNPPKSTPVPLGKSISVSLRFGLKSFIFTAALGCAYILILPFFLVPVLGFLLAPLCSFSFYLLSSFILSRGYFDTIAMLHISDMDRENLWDRYKLSFIAGGFVIAFIFSIPVANLVAPVFSFALMTRLFWRANNKEKAKQQEAKQR